MLNDHDFECENIVSVWIGKFDDEADLLEFVDFKYDSDGNSSNLFCREAGIVWFDHDFQEANFIGEENLPEALRGHSWIGTFESDLMQSLSKIPREKFNSLFLLYDFRYDSEIAKPQGDSRLIFVGHFAFRKN